MAAKEDFDSRQSNQEIPSIKAIKSEDSIQEDDEEEEEDHDDGNHGQHANTSITSKPPQNPNRINSYVLQHKPKSLKYKWKIDLSKTESFWVGWFQGMSQKFIDLHVSKVLLLANLTMDTALTRAQMEG